MWQLMSRTGPFQKDEVQFAEKTVSICVFKRTECSVFFFFLFLSWQLVFKFLICKDDNAGYYHSTLTVFLFVLIYMRLKCYISVSYLFILFSKTGRLCQISKVWLQCLGSLKHLLSNVQKPSESLGGNFQLLVKYEWTLMIEPLLHFVNLYITFIL